MRPLALGVRRVNFEVAGRHQELPIRRDMLGTVRQLLGDMYTIDREIGRGGAARVFQAVDTQGRKVALKVLHPELAVSVTADRFLREIAVLQKLDHPHIARLLDYGEREYIVYYAMRFAEGPNLRLLLDRSQQASVSDTLQIARDLLDALTAAHDVGVVHRDVKPENVVLSPEGAVLLDFGIARAIARSGNERLTRSGFTVGTSYYMSPEQVEGSDEIDHRSDIYSLGCVLFECLAGKPPFQDPLAEAVLQAHQSREAPEVRDVRPETPEALAHAVARALEKAPESRWQSAREMLDSLTEVSV